MKYAFVLGRVFTLSVAELAAVLERPDAALGLAGQPVKILDASEEVLVIETEQPLRADRLQKKLGGVIKILEVVETVKKREQDSINFALKHYFKPSVLKKQFFKDYKGKLQFGVSIYVLDHALLQRPAADKSGAHFNNIFGEPKRLGMMIKNGLTETGASARLVLPEFNSLALASVAVTKNLLLQKGAEICLLAASDKVYTAKTLSVQDFEDYGRRDYQRPVRDEKQGMIPPKVAQIMLNLSGCQSGQTILDPFCGIGTLVQEGLLLGYKMFGSDINKIAIKGSEQNLEWFRNRYKIAPGKYGLEACDAAEVAALIDKAGQKISAVVTECTLGPIYAQYPKPGEISANFKSLETLYRRCFEEFAKFLPQGGRVVVCLPAYRQSRDNYQRFPSLDFAQALGYNQVAIIDPILAKKLKFLKLTDRNTAIYDRKDQIVAREIAVFEKN
ncbi:MAG TPA: DNA methyltransferase [Patescibacteria group bacterium]|nr:DNA methyltransferase [Patescibacteria group bacterium]